MSTAFLDKLGIRLPLIVAPMAGGPTTPQLVVACCEAGALGSLAAAYLSPQEITLHVAQVRARTALPFAVNLFLPHPTPTLSREQIDAVIDATQSFRRPWKLPTPTLQAPFEPPFEAQFEAVLAAKPTAVSFVFGAMDHIHVRAAKARGIVVLGAATCVEEAEQLADREVDGITLQGAESGGHRAVFDPHAADPDVRLGALLRACTQRLRTPLIAAGGLMSARDVGDALRAGAAAVQMGTALLCCEESGTSPPYRRALLDAPRATKLTRAFSGRLARGIENRFMREVPDRAALPFPAQNVFTRDIRAASAARDSSEALSLWCGTGAGDLWTGSAKDLIANLFAP